MTGIYASTRARSSRSSHFAYEKSGTDDQELSWQAEHASLPAYRAARLNFPESR
ncbi:hypothetical protein [Sphingomonas sp. C3-2]|uniref:hypothetical protein n=1 Tax=Sphingomonas sp. C3-2 TaxID=3062169 RepID=UPI00294B15E2|nr:hypothetical protein [Sphingomonas sp. C3-2]WOK35479.1 hypothetical protein QYC26_10690 [Sphingomonas sp. C3-2]